MFFNALKKISIIAAIVLGAFAASYALIIVFLTIFEYRPNEIEDIALKGMTLKTVGKDSPLSIVTWNTGYGDLGDNADFFMDGGKHVRNSTKARVKENLESIADNIDSLGADIVFLQETDFCSHRSYRINECRYFEERFENTVSAYAPNYRAFFVPFPFPPVGKVDSGLLTLSEFSASGAVRIKLPSPFKWPVKTANLKRCLLLSRLPVAGTDRELVLINLHLEAFDSGEGKIAQTRRLLEVMNGEYSKGNYVVVGGDFNQVFSNTDISEYSVRESGWAPGLIDTEDFGSNWIFVQDSSKPTCRANTFPYKNALPEQIQYFVIDGFIVSANIQIEEFRTVDYNFVNSDHNPVYMRFVLK